MPFFRLLLFIIALWAIWKLLKFCVARIRQPDEEKHQVEYGVMVKCSYCEVHVPKTEAIKRNGYFFCSHEHADRGNH